MQIGVHILDCIQEEQEREAAKSEHKGRDGPVQAECTHTHIVWDGRAQLGTMDYKQVRVIKKKAKYTISSFVLPPLFSLCYSPLCSVVLPQCQAKMRYIVAKAEGGGARNTASTRDYCNGNATGTDRCSTKHGKN